MVCLCHLIYIECKWLTDNRHCILTLYKSCITKISRWNMNKYFISYKYVTGYQDGTGDYIYDFSSTLINLDINLIDTISDIKQIIFDNELEWMKKHRSNFDIHEIEIVSLNKL